MKNNNINNNDQIYEAYIGNLGKEMQQKTKKRFSWLSSHLKGKNVLDIGCSQGIFPILLAREGKEIVAIDIDKRALDRANALLECEDDSVKKNVRFIHSSISEFECDGKFDTIILSEILEHQYFPLETIIKAKSLLNEKGTLLITVPFGYNTYLDHKKNYMICDIFELLDKKIKIENVDFIEEWTCIECSNNEQNIVDYFDIMKKLENKCFEVEKNLINKYSASIIENGTCKKDYKDIKNKFEENNILLETVKRVNSNLEQTNKKLSSANTTLLEEKLKFNNKMNLLEKELNSSIAESNRCNEELMRDIDKLELENVSLKNINKEINDSNKKYYNEICNLQKNIKDFNNRKIIKLLRKFSNLKKKVFSIPSRIKNRVSSSYRKTKNNIINTPKINMSLYNNFDCLIERIGSSNGSNYYHKININIGIITDEYMFNYYKDAVNLFYVDYENYKEIVQKVDIVMFVSCWKGMKNNDYKGFSTGISQKKVIEIFEYARENNKKTLFQTIEDPSNYDIYLPIAEKSDYIFSTDVEMISKYKKDTSNNNVFVLDYGINPQFHNPISFKNNNKIINDVFFAGSWAPRYKERCNDSEVLFEGVIESNKNLVLADRNSGISGYEFPSKYNKYIIPAINHEKLQRIHKLFDWAINVNSIKYSPTMCAMRIYELQAIGNLMISNYSVAVNNTFPNIFISKTSFEVSSILNSYNELEIFKMQVDGIRNVMSNHTVFNKLNYIFSCIVEEKYIQNNKKVLVLCNKKNKKINEMFNSQSYVEKDIMEINFFNKAVSKKYDYITYFDNEKKYGRYYIEDMLNAFKYTNVDFVSIISEILQNKVVGISHEYINESNSICSTIIDSKKYDMIKLIKEGSISGNGYCIDPFQISVTRYEKNDEKELSVIVPIYNNGKFLLNKCFNSLLRSTIFDKMSVILVDDGSDDIETLNIIKDIEKKYSNVVTHYFNDGGSGSASRPRNKGVELSKTKYITYLDPDNEAINDGYAKLLAIAKKGDYDFTFGNIIKLYSKESVLRYGGGSSREINNPKAELIKNNFKTNSIQACIIKKELITNNNILNPIGAAGQDSFFFQEMMINAKKIYYLDLPIHIYYASRNNSIINTISHKFFDKFFIMEKYQVKKLREYGLLEEYKKRRLGDFFENWYLEKLKLVTDQNEYEKCLKIVNEIGHIYEK